MAKQWLRYKVIFIITSLLDYEEDITIKIEYFFNLEEAKRAILNNYDRSWNRAQIEHRASSSSPWYPIETKCAEFL
jgi:hypothetical protein